MSGSAGQKFAAMTAMGVLVLYSSCCGSARCDCEQPPPFIIVSVDDPAPTGGTVEGCFEGHCDIDEITLEGSGKPIAEIDYLVLQLPGERDADVDYVVRDAEGAVVRSVTSGASFGSGCCSPLGVTI